MVVNMIEKKDPHQKISPDDFDDDDDIIELTDEVIIKPEDDDEIIDLQGTGTVVSKTPAGIPAKTDENEPESDEQEEDIIALEATPEAESQAEGGAIDLDKGDSDYESTVAEDDIIASAIVASLGADDDDLHEDGAQLIDEAGTRPEEDDDFIILSEDDDDPAALSAPAAIAAEKDEGVFDTEEEIELEYEGDEDQYDFFALDDKQTLEELETISMNGEGPDDAEDDDILFDSVTDLDLNSDEDDEIIAMADDPQEGPELMALDDEETLEFGEGGDLPDLTDELEFEFDDEDDENGFVAADDQVAEDSDDILARPVEKAPAPDGVTAWIDPAMEPGFEPTEDSEIMTEDDQQAEEADLTATTIEKIRELAEADGLPDIDDDTDLKFEDEEGDSDIDNAGDLGPEDAVLTIENFDDHAAEEEDGIIEITEFDEHFPAEDEKKLERAGILDALDSDADDFLELIEVEDDNSAGHEEVIEFSNSEEQIDEDEINNFFSETIEEDPLFEKEGIEPLEEIPAVSTDTAMATAPPADEDEEFDFSFDSSEISMQVDRLDTFLSDDLTAEPEVASLPEEPPVEEKVADEDHPAVEDKTEPLPVTPDQIDAILEDAIKNKLSGKIENIIYEVIEKAVSKEIDRLKTALLYNTGPGDDE
jgi:hypothetical protein